MIRPPHPDRRGLTPGFAGRKMPGRALTGRARPGVFWLRSGLLCVSLLLGGTLLFGCGGDEREPVPAAPPPALAPPADRESWRT